MTTLVQDQTSNGAGAWVVWSGGPGYFETFGTFDGASIALEVTFDNGTVVHEVTSAGVKDLTAIDLPICQVRANVAGVGASTSVSARLF